MMFEDGWEKLMLVCQALITTTKLIDNEEEKASVNNASPHI